MRIIIVLAIISLGFMPDIYSQTDFPALKQQFLDYRKEDKQDSALFIAKKMNSLALQEQSDTSYWYALSMRYQGNVYSTWGNHDSSIYYLENAAELFEKYQPSYKKDLSTTFNTLGILNDELGNYYLGETYYKRSIRSDSTNFYPRMNLGWCNMSMGNYKKADEYFSESFIFCRDSYDKVGYFCSHAFLKIIIGDLEKAAILLKESKYLIDSNGLGKEKQADWLITNSLLNIQLENYKIAEDQLLEFLSLILYRYGNNHPFYLAYKENLAYIYLKTDRYYKAYEVFNENFTKKSLKISDNFNWLSEREKLFYWKQESVFYENIGYITSQAHKVIPEFIGLNYNSALIAKGKLLEVAIRKENYYTYIDEIRQELIEVKKLLNRLESDGSHKIGLIEKLRQEADSLDKQLELSWPAYAEQKRNLLITWDQVRENLSEGEAAIEFVRFREHQDSAYQYQALIIRKDSALPLLASLCSEREILAIDPNSGFSSYYDLVWEPLEKHLEDIKTVFYAPVGELYNVPFHAIYAPNGQGDQQIFVKGNNRGAIQKEVETKSEENAVFLMDRYTLHQLTSTRYLALDLKEKSKETLETSITMVGGVNYDYLPGGQNSKVKKLRSTKKSNNRSSNSASGKLDFLKGTEKEIKSIKGTLVPKNWETLSLNGNEAKEETITKFTDKEAKGVLHIATHGYAFPEYSSLDTTIKQNSLRYSYRFSQNPMVRSGLVLTGGNWAWTGSDTLNVLGAKENGILTALEVSGLNLRNTKLVVLSACETGLGKIEGSEGTFGLKRGFKLAGVEQIIVSLWSVPDKETTELMTIFYEDLSVTLNPVISFAKAQKEMRNKYPTRPDLWAGFVLVR